ncbi:MAG: molybdate ABC transporter permease subunit [Pseudomonadota bacterium]|nr:molybdate ABC transporter permease subunit [Pseudomonadota bacterium]
MSYLTPIEFEALNLSLKVAITSVLFSLPFAVIAAWLLARRDFPGHLLFDAIIHVPLVIPPVVVGYILLLLFGAQGPIGQALNDVFGIRVIFTWKGAAIASSVMAFPLMVRSIRLSFSSLDKGLEEAAATLGAAPLRVFYSVTLPMIMPGLIVGCFLGFARSLGEFGATITFVSNIPGETRTLPLALYTHIQTPGADTPAIRLVIISILIALGALFASELLSRRVNRRIRG